MIFHFIEGSEQLSLVKGDSLGWKTAKMGLVVCQGGGDRQGLGDMGHRDRPKGIF